MMPPPIKTFVLVVKRDDGAIHSIIRTYLSYQRAQEDCELMARQTPLLNFEVLTIDLIYN